MMAHLREQESVGEFRAVVLTDDFGGGTGNHLLQLARHWTSAGVDTEIITPAPRTARFTSPVPVTKLQPIPERNVFPFGQLRRYQEIRALLRCDPPDVLHTYFFWSIIYGRLLRMAGHVPALIENREDEGFAWGRLEYTLLQLSRNVPDRVICVANAVKEQAIRREKLTPELTTVIHNGVSTSDPIAEETLRSLKAEFGATDDEPIVGMVANLNRPIKGARFLVDAAPRILDAVPSARIVFVGDGDRIPRLRRRTRTRGVEDSVTFTGYRDDIDALYEILTVSVLSSLSEGLSITVLESMSRGLPVVATRVGGTPEVVMDGTTGILVDPARPDQLAEAVIRLLEDEELRDRMATAGKERVQSNFRLETVAGRYLDHYRDLAHS